MPDTNSASELGSRSIISVAANPDLIETVQSQVMAWCSRKDWDARALTTVGIASVSHGVYGSFVRGVIDEDSSTIARWRFSQTTGTDLWVTEITVLHRHDRTGIVWTDLLAPPKSSPKTPEILRKLASKLDGKDGGFSLTQQPKVGHVDDIEDIFGAIMNPSRRGLIFVAASTSGSNIDFSKWSTYASQLLEKTNGLASAFILDPHATEEFNRRISGSHAVTPWTVRTYYPNPILLNRADSLRHRILSTSRITTADAHHVAQILGEAARRHSLQLRLPPELTKADRRARALLDDAIAARAGTSRPPSGGATILPSQPPTLTQSDSHPRQQSPAADVISVLMTGLFDIVGSDELSAENIEHLLSHAADGLSHSQSLSQILNRLKDVEAERSLLEDERTELAVQLEGTQLDYAIAQQDLEKFEREVVHLRGELARIDQGTVDWSVPHEDTPDSFRDIHARFNEFEWLSFTGDSKFMFDLEAHDPHGSWALRTWTILRALNDYGKLRSTGKFSGSVDEYANNTPDGYTGLTGHKQSETSLTKTHKNYGRARTLPVPTTVAPSGYLFMGAHVAIAQSGMNSPRLHYHNDAHASGTIYVGYIGRHLPNFRTN